jgi:hypothetical protein
VNEANAVLSPFRGSDRGLRPIPAHWGREPRPFSLEPVAAMFKPEGFETGEPFEGHVYAQGQLAEMSSFLGVDRQSIGRWTKQGLSAYVADAVAIRLNVHPVEIWSDWFSHAAGDEELAVAS